MVKHDHDHDHHHVDGGPHNDPLLACCCCPCMSVSSAFRLMGRCLFVACYPVLQCFRWDDHRHHHHHHKHFYWFYFLFISTFIQLEFLSLVRSFRKKPRNSILAEENERNPFHYSFYLLCTIIWSHKVYFYSPASSSYYASIIIDKTR